MLALRTSEGLVVAVFEKEFKVLFTDAYSVALSRNRDFLEVQGSKLRIKDEYLFVQNSILMPFMEDNEKF